MRFILTKQLGMPPVIPRAVTSIVCCITTGVLGLAAPMAFGADFYWSPAEGTGGSGTWDLSTASWATNASGTGTKSNYTAATLTGTTTSGSPTVTMSDTTGVAIRQMVYGTGIATATLVTNLAANTSIGLSANATASGSTSLTFSRAGDSLIFAGTAGTITLSTPLSIGDGSLRFTTSGYTISGDSNNAIWQAGTPNATYGTVFVANEVSASVSGFRASGNARFDSSGNGTLTLSNSSLYGVKVGGDVMGGQSYTNTVVFGPNVSISAYLRVNNTSKAQLMGNNLSVANFNSDSNSFNSSVIENGGASDATLSAIAYVGGGVYYGILQDGSGGGKLGLTISKENTNQAIGLGGTLANTYSGVTTINEGILYLLKSDGVDAIGGNVTMKWTP